MQQREKIWEPQEVPHSVGTAGTAPSSPTETAVMEHGRLRGKQTVSTMRLPLSISTRKPLERKRRKTDTCQEQVLNSTQWKACRESSKPPSQAVQPNKDVQNSERFQLLACSMISGRSFKSTILKNSPF